MFRVTILGRAKRDFRSTLRYIAEHSKPGAVAWAKAFDKALARLEQGAESFPQAAENEYIDFEVREILFKTRRGLVYRALFTIQGDEVLILHVRGPGQEFLTEEQFGSVE